MILVTGASGTLGSALLPRLVEAGAAVRGLSRKPREGGGVEWATGDLTTGEGLAEALQGVDVIVHAASDPMPGGSKDTDTTRRLVETAVQAGTPHLVYISIVGVDGHAYGYYRTKYATEQIVERSGLPYTILRTTQWHQLLDKALGMVLKSPIVPVPNLPVQPLDVSEVAVRMAELALGEPIERAEDMGGPEIRNSVDLARLYVRAAGKRRLVTPFRIPGKAGRDFRDGRHLAPEHTQGTLTFEDFLRRRFR